MYKNILRNNFDVKQDEKVNPNFNQFGAELKYLIPGSDYISKINFITSLIKPLNFAWIKKISRQNKI